MLLRFSEEEVREILVYGRPGTPMPAWGTEGGGPLTSQQIDELIAYLYSIQISAEDARAQVETELRAELGLGEDARIDYDDPAVGEALFNLGIESGEAGAAYSCARCHTKGASFLYGAVDPADADLSDYTGFPDGSGAFGFSLTEGVIPRQFLDLEELAEFIHTGSEYGILYGQRGQGSGRMPGFGDNPDDDDDLTDDAPDDGMFTADMVEAVARYEASLGGEAAGTGVAAPEDGSEDEDESGSESATTTTTEGS